MERSQESDDEPLRDLKKNLAKILCNIETIGSFAIFGPLKSMVNPDLTVQNVGGISLPLSNTDAARIITASHKAPFGKGTKTVLDESIRKTWELSNNEFTVANPKWNIELNKILEKISDGLGLSVSGRSISAELYKLLLYEEGAMFKPHQDSEKAPGMFATLVIALPSKHEGGELHLSHAGQKKIFETSQNSELGYSYSAWFADVIHEVKPVVSGRRLVLTYNLIQTSHGKVETAANSTKCLTKLRSLFSGWQKQKSETDHDALEVMAYMFDHHYTEASLAYDALKGKDLQVALNIKEAAAENSVYVCLANITRTVWGGCDESKPNFSYRHDRHHAIDEIIENDLSLVYVAELDGSEIARDIPFDEERIVQEDPFRNLMPDKEEFSGHTGNEGTSATHVYHRTVALIMPKSQRISFLIQSTDPIKWLDKISKEMIETPKSADAGRVEMAKICNLIINQAKASSQKYSDAVLARVLQAVADLDDKDLFLDAYDLLSGKVPAYAFGFIGAVVSRHNLLELLPQLNFEFSRFAALGDRHSIISMFRKELLGERIDVTHSMRPIYDWVDQQYVQCLTSATCTSAPDGLAASYLFVRFSDKTFDTILPIIKQNVRSSAMAITFLVYLGLAQQAGKISESLLKKVFGNVLPELIKHFSIDGMARGIATAKRFKASDGSSIPALEASEIFLTRDLAKFLHCLHAMNLQSELAQIVQKICGDAERRDAEFLHHMMLPFLKSMIEILREKKIIVAGSPFRSLFQKILTTYILQYVKREPSTDDWTREEKGCPWILCPCCSSLKEFLRSSTKRVERFSGSKIEQIHLRQQLNNSSCTHVTDKRTNILVVTKSTIDSPYEAWKQRHQLAKKEIEALGSALLKKLLEEMYEFIVTFSAVTRSPVYQSISTSSALPSQTPAWLNQRLADLRVKYPDDLFELVLQNPAPNTAASKSVPTASPDPPSSVHRIKCLDCPGRLYIPGPLMTLQNFESHLKRADHRNGVSGRLGQSNATPVDRSMDGAEDLKSATSASRTLPPLSAINGNSTGSTVSTLSREDVLTESTQTSAELPATTEKPKGNALMINITDDSK